MRRISKLSTDRWTPGFTIVELLIVIVVIGILAAITIVAYNGISQKALATTIQSDLTSSYNALASDNTTNGSYPPTATAANSGKGLPADSGTTVNYTYVPAVNGYCLVQSVNSISYYITSESNIPTIGISCPLWGSVTTYAGNGQPYEIDGTGTSASFSYPVRLIAKDDNTIYVIDGGGGTIRKITSSGVVTTLAGSSSGFADGTGSGAKFQNPQGLTVDSSGNVYVADTYNYRIRKITPAGVVTTLAGSSSNGSADGTGAVAQFNCPSDITISPDQTLYVADTCNNVIRKVTLSGVVTTFAGTAGYSGTSDGVGGNARFSQPSGLFMTQGNILYVADSSNNRVRKITSDGTVTTVAGSSAGYVDGAGASARFNYPMGITVAGDNNIYVADSNNNVIRRVTPSGVVTTIAGSGIAGYADGQKTSASFYKPTGIAVYNNNTVYVSDQNNYYIRKIQ